MQSFTNHVSRIATLPEDERREIEDVAVRYAFRANDYYLSLIDWHDPDDPIRRLIVPSVAEMEEWGQADPSDEKNYTILPGLEHKYRSTVLLLVSGVCAGICRFCFRKRIFQGREQEVLRDLDGAVAYIAGHPEVSNVLLTGGDPLMLSTNRLERIVGALRGIEHVKIVRLGSKVPAFLPSRILDDEALAPMLGRYSLPDARIYIMTHFNHPRELTADALAAADRLLRNGIVLCNQTPMVRGVNDHPDTLAELLGQLSFAGIAPYYVFQCRPSMGNRTYAVPIEEGYEIFEQAKAQVSGLAKRARFVMSHRSGKIEVVGLADDRVYFRYLRAADETDSGRFLVARRNPDAFWFDDYEEFTRNASPMETAYSAHGPE